MTQPDPITIAKPAKAPATIFDIAKAEAESWANSGPDFTLDASDKRTFAAICYAAGFQNAFNRREEIERRMRG